MSFGVFSLAGGSAHGRGATKHLWAAALSRLCWSISVKAARLTPDSSAARATVNKASQRNSHRRVCSAVSGYQAFTTAEILETAPGC